MLSENVPLLDEVVIECPKCVETGPVMTSSTSTAANIIRSNRWARCGNGPTAGCEDPPPLAVPD